MDPHFKTGTPESRPDAAEIDHRLRLPDGRLFFYVGFTQILALGRQNKMTGLPSSISTSCVTNPCTATSAST